MKIQKLLIQALLLLCIYALEEGGNGGDVEETWDTPYPDFGDLCPPLYDDDGNLVEQTECACKLQADHPTNPHPRPWTPPFRKSHFCHKPNGLDHPNCC